jgi:phosphatidylglycerophosphate synthase
MTRQIDPRDLLQPPTAITAASLMLVIEGAKSINTQEGKAKVAVGRLGDLLDGYVARRFDMSSDAGAIADVVSDKLGMLAIGIGMWRNNIAPKSVLTAIAAKNAVNAAATLHNGLLDAEKRAIRPPKEGKLSMAADSLSLISFAIADELEGDSTAYRAARALGWTAAGVGLVAGSIAAKRYLSGDFDEAL